MANADETCWQQRLDNFSRALRRLSAACAKREYSDLERCGLVQIFGFNFALAWKTLQDLLFYEGYPVNSPRSAIRQGFAAGYLGEEDCEALLNALDKRRLFSHIYREELAMEAETLIKTRYNIALTALHTKLQAYSQA